MKTELIYLDQKALTKAEKDLATATEKLNNFVKMVIDTLGSLEPSQIKALESYGHNVIRDEIRSRFQFPHASEAFNLEALGLDPEPLYKYFSENSELWSQFSFTFDPDFNEFTPDEKQRQFEACYFYADTPERIRLMKLARKTIELYDELKESNLLNSPTMFWKSFTFGLFTQNYENKLSLSQHNMESFIMKADRGEYEIRK